MEHAEIDVNDPDFWKKVLPDLVTPDIMFERLSDESLCEDEVRTYMRVVILLDLKLKKFQCNKRHNAFCTPPSRYLSLSYS